MALHNPGQLPPTNGSVTPPPTTTVAGIHITTPEVLIVATLSVMVALYFAVRLYLSKWTARDPLARQILRQARRSKQDIVVVNIDVATRSVQFYFGEKLSPSLYYVRDRVTGEELVIPVTSESMIGTVKYGNVVRPVLITVRKGETIPVSTRLESLSTSIPVGDYDGEPELLANLAKVSQELSGYISLSPTTKLVYTADPKLLLTRRLQQELEIMSAIPVLVKEISARMLKLMELQLKKMQQETARRVMLIMVAVVAVVIMLAVIGGLHIIP